MLFLESDWTTLVNTLTPGFLWGKREGFKMVAEKGLTVPVKLQTYPSLFQSGERGMISIMLIQGPYRTLPVSIGMVL